MRSVLHSWRFIGLPIVLLSVACGGGDRYAIVSGGENTVYRLDKHTGEVFLVKGDRSWRVLSPAAEELPRADLRNLQVVGLEGPVGNELFVHLYNGTAIEFSAITFSVRTVHKGTEEVRLYSTQVALKPFEASHVSFTVLSDGTSPRQVVIVSAKGIRRET